MFIQLKANRIGPRLGWVMTAEEERWVGRNRRRSHNEAVRKRAERKREKRMATDRFAAAGVQVESSSLGHN